MTNSNHSFLPEIKKKYRIAIFSIALLVTFSFLLLQAVLTTIANDASIINAAGKQRMLSQKTALYTEMMARELKEHNAIKNELVATINELEKNRLTLLGGDTPINNKTLPPAIWRHYFGGTTSLYQLELDYIAAAKTVIKIDSEDYQGQFSHSEVSYLLTQLDAMVSLFELEAQEKLSRIVWLSVVTWILALTLLFFELKFIFKPIASL